ncbi:MAG: DUF5615 family PIN-like protein [Nostoc sp.]|uniref:DUF5615 family PIN-like protein n=1 Tax=Nostoc sp. TaxID=1180 RepID=UPI002FEF4AB5
MTQKIRFHLDENVSNAIAEGLRRRGIDVTTTSETGLIAASDGEQLYFAVFQYRVIFTHDDDFVILHQAGAYYARRNYFLRSEPPLNWGNIEEFNFNLGSS